jgi:hypothetical protein
MAWRIAVSDRGDGNNAEHHGHRDLDEETVGAGASLKSARLTIPTGGFRLWGAHADRTVSPVRGRALSIRPLCRLHRLRTPLLDLCQGEGIKGTLLLAGEGVNGTIAGTQAGIARVVAHIRALPGCAGLDVKYSTATTMPFHRMKVRIKREIVTMGQPDLDPLTSVGTYVEPQDWNALSRTRTPSSSIRAMITRWPWAVLPVPLIRRPAASPNFPHGSGGSGKGCWARAKRRKWRCSAPVVSAAKNPPLS